MKTINSQKAVRIVAAVAYAAIIICIATATLIESRRGSDFVLDNIYHSAWFMILWGIVVISAVFMLIKSRTKSLPVIMLHAAFVLILAGALLTFCTSKKGIVHLRENSFTDYFTDADGNFMTFGFAIALDSFKIEYHPGTKSPADYISYIRVATPDSVVSRHTISMNNIASIKHYRLYQSSFDKDMHGSYLSVNYDPWGIASTYSGYALMFVSFILLMLNPRGKFRTMLKNPLLQKAGLVLLLPLLFCDNANAAPVLKRSEADSLKNRPVLYQNRIAPFNTVARDFTIKLYGKDTYNGLSSEQVICSFILYPEEWSSEKILKVKNKALRDSLGISGKYASWQDLYDGSYYKLQKFMMLQGTDADFTKAVKDIDDKQTLLLMLRQNSLFNPVLTQESLSHVNQNKLNAEVFYNKLNLNSIMFKLNMTIGILALLYFLFCMFSPKRLPKVGLFLYCYNALSFVLLFLYQALRWYISGHVPLSNGFECMVSVACLANLFGLFDYRHKSLLSTAAILVSGATLMVSSFSSSNPAINHLMPVLNSPWLSAHVSCMILSYALCAITAVNSSAAIVAGIAGNKNNSVEAIGVLNNIILYPAVAFMATGIFLGAIWANVSWGRYWAWDPKESWALISLMLYSLPLHTWFKSMFKNKIGIHIYYLLCILSIAMTYFGVNNLLGGMHSYS